MSKRVWNHNYVAAKLATILFFILEKSACCCARSVAALCRLLLTIFFIYYYLKDFRSQVIDIAYFMVEIKTFDAKVHIAAITVKDASPIFVFWIATGPSMKLTRWILCLWTDRAGEISCIKMDLQLSLIRMKCFIIHDGRFLGGIFGVTVPALKSAAIITIITLPFLS
jgi:hypothetical protein